MREDRAGRGLLLFQNALIIPPRILFWLICSTNAVSIGIQDEGAIWPIEKFFAKDFDWSNYSKKIRVNGVCIITNDNKKLLAVRIISVKSIDYGADCNELVIDYKMIGE